MSRAVRPLLGLAQARPEPAVWKTCWRQALCIGFPTLIMGASGIAKLLDLPGFALHLRSWGVFPDSVIPAMVGFVPGVEVFFAGAWWLGIGRPWAARALVALLLVYSAALGYLAAVQPEASCGCLGWLTRGAPFWDTPRGGLLRNALLLAMFLIGRRSTRKAGL